MRTPECRSRCSGGSWCLHWPYAGLPFQLVSRLASLPGAGAGAGAGAGLGLGGRGLLGSCLVLLQLPRQVGTWLHARAVFVEEGEHDPNLLPRRPLAPFSATMITFGPLLSPHLYRTSFEILAPVPLSPFRAALCHGLLREGVYATAWGWWLPSLVLFPPQLQHGVSRCVPVAASECLLSSVSGALAFLLHASAGSGTWPMLQSSPSCKGHLPDMSDSLLNGTDSGRIDETAKGLSATQPPLLRHGAGWPGATKLSQRNHLASPASGLD